MAVHAYIHTPFCLRKCRYCSFISGINIKHKKRYLDALLKEISLRYKNETLNTLYFGGGTPSLLESEEIKRLISCFNLEKDAEITLEANPETVYAEKFQEYKKIGINRVSLGVQSFNNELLTAAGRGHNADDARNAVKILKESGFKNISIDLIYGLPSQTLQMFENDLKCADELDIQHISAYGLKIDDGCYFSSHPPENLPDDSAQADMYIFMHNFLKRYNHYEISSFARPGFNSRHNCAYWLNKEYYGFGVNASGYENGMRYKNVSNFEEYIKNPLKREEEFYPASAETLENEIFLALRLKQGVNIIEINKKFNIDFETEYSEIIKKYEALNLMQRAGGFCRLTLQGFLLSSEIMQEFINV